MCPAILSAVSLGLIGLGITILIVLILASLFLGILEGIILSNFNLITCNNYLFRGSRLCIFALPFESS